VRVNIKKIYPALEELATKILTIQAEGIMKVPGR